MNQGMLINKNYYITLCYGTCWTVCIIYQYIYLFLFNLIFIYMNIIDEYIFVGIINKTPYIM